MCEVHRQDVEVLTVYLAVVGEIALLKCNSLAIGAGQDVEVDGVDGAVAVDVAIEHIEGRREIIAGNSVGITVQMLAIGIGDC